jgi:TrmH family RNA methyltransferase
MTHDLRIVLVETSHPGNIGATARAMKNMGLETLVLVRPKVYPHAEATARASGADDVLARARVCGTILEAVSDCGLVLATSARPRTARWEVLDPRAAALRATEAMRARPVAILFGGERNGLSNDDLALCHGLINIPANPAYESLNLAQAVQIVAWELAMARGATVRQLPAEALPATAAQMDRLYVHLEEVLFELGFTDPVNAPHLMGRLRRLFGRAALDDNEVQILRGILTAVQQRRRRDGTG